MGGDSLPPASIATVEPGGSAAPVPKRAREEQRERSCRVTAPHLARIRRVRVVGLVLLALAVAAIACEDDTNDTGAVVRFSLEADLAGGQEAHFCRYVRMPAGAEPIWVMGGSHQLTAGTHHYLLYRTRLTAWTPDLDATVPCDEHAAVMQSATNYVTGGQTPHENADFPAAAALELAPGEILLLQGHFLNASPKPHHAKVEVALRLTPASKVEHKASVLRFYNPFIFVPPRGTATAGAECTLKRDVTLIAAAGHMHARGTAYRAYADPPGGPKSATPFYTTRDGLHPDFWGGFSSLPAGTTLRFECDYASHDDTPIIQGLSAVTNEMCMLSAFYYPAMDPADEACADMHGNGTGTSSCIDTVACLEQCPAGDAPDFSNGDPRVGECWQRCVTASCPNAAAALFPQLTCTQNNCRAECTQMGEPCRECVRSRCAAELEACTRLPCGP